MVLYNVQSTFKTTISPTPYLTLQDSAARIITCYHLTKLQLKEACGHPRQSEKEEEP